MNNKRQGIARPRRRAPRWLLARALHRAAVQEIFEVCLQAVENLLGNFAGV
jgi:hypothetical protein